VCVHGGLARERFVEWWCSFIGITDTTAVEITVGVAGAASLVFALRLAWLIGAFVIAALSDQ
jgi:hypothetical protein